MSFLIIFCTVTCFLSIFIQIKMAQKNREELFLQFKLTRDELKESLRLAAEQTRQVLQDASQHQGERLSFISQNQENLLKNNTFHLTQLADQQRQSLDSLRQTIEQQLHRLNSDNIVQLEKMRVTVDEKLQATLEQRLTSSFKLVGDRLEAVHSSMGEMQKIASEVNQLQRVLTSVKTKGIMGEIQLERILMDILTPEQYEKNVKTKKESLNFVEFAIKLPQKVDGNQCVWLPIDAKFPTEDYARLQEAHEKNQFELVPQFLKSLEQKIKTFSKDMRDKYINPPETTDFAILFLPTEGLYSEVLRIPGLTETIRREMNVVISGPSTLSAILNSLQMGFRTLAVEKRTTEINKLLGAIKTDFVKFGDLLDKTQKKLDEASKQIGDATHRSKQISRKLVRVESLPEHQASVMLNLEQEFVD